MSWERRVDGLRCAFADDLALLRNLTEVYLQSPLVWPGWCCYRWIGLTFPLLVYLIQLMRNLNCSSFEAGAIRAFEDSASALEVIDTTERQV